MAYDVQGLDQQRELRAGSQIVTFKVGLSGFPDSEFLEEINNIWTVYVFSAQADKDAQGRVLINRHNMEKYRRASSSISYLLVDIDALYYVDKGKGVANPHYWRYPLATMPPLLSPPLFGVPLPVAALPPAAPACARAVGGHVYMPYRVEGILEGEVLMPDPNYSQKEDVVWKTPPGPVAPLFGENVVNVETFSSRIRSSIKPPFTRGVGQARVRLKKTGQVCSRRAFLIV